MMKKFLFTLALATLASACGNTSTESDPPPPGTTVRTLTCADFSVGAGLTCANNASGKARIDLITGTAADTAVSATDPRLIPGAAQGTFAGMITPAGGSLGQRFQNGTVLGVRAANTQCSTTFTGAHACTNDEIYKSAYAGQIPPGTTGAIFQSGAYNESGIAAASGSDRASCSEWTTSNGATGSKFDVLLTTVGGVTGPLVKLTPNQSCAVSLQVACCF